MPIYCFSDSLFELVVFLDTINYTFSLYYELHFIAMYICYVYIAMYICRYAMFHCYVLFCQCVIRSTLAKLRLSAHNLHIETGRFSKNRPPRDERFCTYCKTLNIFTVENEVHFLLSCSLLNEE